MEIIEFKDTNKQQQYSTHSIFRYFGKLPPTLVARLLEEYNPNLGRVLELMCGSGTALLEAKLHNMHADGIDINPLSVMISNVKNTPIPSTLLNEALLSFASFTEAPPKESFSYFRPKTRNLDNWFTQTAQNECSAIRYFIDIVLQTEDSFSIAIKNFMSVSFAGIVRKVSNASERTGRVFRCNEDCTLSPFAEMIKRIESNIAAIGTLDPTLPINKAVIGDARTTPFTDDSYEFVLNHPPYFALYKYSSDVMRFELEWLGFDRKQIASREIEDGFKTTNAGLVDTYISDMRDVLIEARRLVSNSGVVCVVVSDSTLREEQLPIIDKLIPAAESTGLSLREHKLRPVSFAQASYHKSANPRIKTNEDHVLVFSKD